MKAERPRDLALKTLNRLDAQPRYPGNYLDEIFQSHPYLDERDRAFISQLVQGVLRWRLRLDWVLGQFSDLPLKKIDAEILNILRLALYQVYFLDRVPESAAVNEAVNQAKAKKGTRRAASFVNGMLRNICRRKQEITFPDRERDIAGYFSSYYSYPLWLVNKWLRELGREFTEELLSAQNRFPDLNIRANILKISRDGLLKRLSDQGIGGRAASYAPQGIVLEGFRGRVDELPQFREGLFQVQDQAAQIISHLLGPRPGDMVLDLCAGLGGKSTHIMELMGGRGKVLGLDISHRRLISLGQNTRRLGITGIEPVRADASSLSSLFRCKFDRVLLDAPCSGLGVISRHPDGKWNRDEEDIRNLSFLQKRLIEETSFVMKGGGRMLYATCTISREENEDVVSSFLEHNRDMSLEDLRGCVPQWGLDLIDEKGFLKTYPNVHHMDGFFAALFRKNR